MSITKYIIIFLMFVVGCGGTEDGHFRPLNEDEQYIWDMVAECFETRGYDTTTMHPVLIQYVESPCNNVNYAGCAWSDNGVSYIHIGSNYAYADPGQYPDFVWTDLNVELFIHEFLHRFGAEIFGHTEHGGIEYITCPQNLWNNPALW